MISPEFYPVDKVRHPPIRGTNQGDVNMIVSVGYTHSNVNPNKVADHVRGEPLYQFNIRTSWPGPRYPHYFRGDQLTIEGRVDYTRERADNAWLGDIIENEHTHARGKVHRLTAAGGGDIRAVATNVAIYNDERFVDINNRMRSIVDGIHLGTTDLQIAESIGISEKRLESLFESIDAADSVQRTRLSAYITQLDGWKQLEYALTQIKRQYTMSVVTRGSSFHVVERNNSALLLA